MPGDSYDDVLQSAAASGGVRHGHGSTGPAERDSEGISLADMDGRYSTLRPTNHNIPRLHVVERSGTVHTYQYVHLQSDSSFAATENGQVFTLEFALTDQRLARITVEGRNLWRVFDYCTLHRWPYLKAADRDIAQGKEPVITDIRIEEMVQEEDE